MRKSPDSPDTQPGCDALTGALRRMPIPPPRPGWAAAALARAVREAGPGRRQTGPVTGWALAASAGGLALLLGWFVLRTPAPAGPPPLLVEGARDVILLIESDRALDEATITIRLSGSAALQGYEDLQEVHWSASLERGNNLLTLPVRAVGSGPGQLVAEVGHGGRVKRIVVNVTAARPGPPDTTAVRASGPLGRA